MSAPSAPLAALSLRLVALGGAAGAAVRYAIDSGAHRHVSGFPWLELALLCAGGLAVGVLVRLRRGAFALGFLTAFTGVGTWAALGATTRPPAAGLLFLVVGAVAAGTALTIGFLVARPRTGART
ncbi:hypothetical protein P0W64_13925 [Tsukamurella sp. 8F]|uniref:hypothetical protein n=1 Tax=unclassified Tsukamurella TaxID=2633480 RepID=UPI0023B9C428|nr:MULTISPECIES: hypothetical protein [unclassified Tsukamurella]MDF0530671.1 hypothetical protein [Tsukamurella sp. 8J]MDF0587872.1 hypothetical protein [Tsukamurella sp. 8F]